jgi:hypothetical protein
MGLCAKIRLKLGLLSSQFILKRQGRRTPLFVRKAMVIQYTKGLETSSVIRDREDLFNMVLPFSKFVVSTA